MFEKRKTGSAARELIDKDSSNNHYRKGGQGMTGSLQRLEAPRFCPTISQQAIFRPIHLHSADEGMLVKYVIVTVALAGSI